jgi:2-polyprenyl-3-methyl-5-hydroxy-6-metoxy-1,4-benzoquinol methylase
MNWNKQTSLAQQGTRDKEIWIREENGKTAKFPVEIYMGKKTNLLKLKKNIVESIQKQVSYYQDSRTKLYNQSEMENVNCCMVCGTDSNDTSDATTIYGANYVQCNHCSHVYVIKRPAPKAIHNFYLNDITYAATYTDRSAAESRLNSIAVPWANWMIDVFEQQHGRKPKSVLDVGSGAGHFVEACRRMGIQADGVELSESSREFSQEIWGIRLDGRDFTEVVEDYKGYDIVTFWGLLEHTPNPGQILKAAFDVVSASDAGMVISKLPRWNSLSSAIQKLVPETVIRHLDPMGHIMAFSDASAAELYTRNGFAPVAAWYYGMDIYETFMQIGHKTSSFDPLIQTGDLQVELQQAIDEVRFADGLTLVGVPIV